MLHHDATTVRADLASGNSSAAFRTRQTAEYRNLVTLPLTTWSYTVAEPSNDAGAQRAAAAKYGRPAVIYHLTLRYALAGADRGPTQQDLWWTFVSADGHAVVAGDTDLADYGGTSWRGPWDFGPLTVVHDGPALVIAHESSQVTGSLLHQIAATVRAAIPAVSSVWGVGWARHVVVLVPASAAELSADAGTDSEVTAAAAAEAVSDGRDPLSGQVYGQRLIVEPSEFLRLSTVGRQIVVRHELTHIATADATGELTPRWVIEGFADYVGNLDSGQPVRVVASELRTQLRRTGEPGALPTDVQFETAGTAASAYEQAWLACRLIATLSGQPGLVRFYRLAGSVSGGTADPADLLADPFRSVLHESTAEFTARWRSYLRTELR